MLLACGAFAIVPFLGPGEVEIFFFVCVLTGMTLGADLSLPPAMQADIGRWREDHPRAASFIESLYADEREAKN